MERHKKKTNVRRAPHLRDVFAVGLQYEQFLRKILSRFWARVLVTNHESAEGDLRGAQLEKKTEASVSGSAAGVPPAFSGFSYPETGPGDEQVD